MKPITEMSDTELQEVLVYWYSLRDEYPYESSDWILYDVKADDVRCEMARRDAAVRAQQEAE